MLQTLLSSDQVIKLIRTGAQAVGGLLVALLVRWGIDVDEGALFEVIYPISVGVWVILVDFLVRYVNPGFERLNVISKTPNYSPVQADAE